MVSFLFDFITMLPRLSNHLKTKEDAGKQYRNTDNAELCICDELILVFWL